jgi:hypothetical protein
MTCVFFHSLGALNVAVITIFLATCGTFTFLVPLLRDPHDLRGHSPQQVDAELRRRHLDPDTRLAVKLEMRAAADASRPRGLQLRALGELATDRAAEPRPKSAMDRLLDRAQVDPTRTYTDAELTERLQQAGITDPEQRLCLRIECHARGLVRDPNEADRLLRNLGIDGPVHLEAVERVMDKPRQSFLSAGGE